MPLIKKPLRLNRMDAVFIGVLIGANFLTAASMSLLYPLIRSEANLQHYEAVMEGLGPLVLLTFLVPSVLCGIYIRPLEQPRPDRLPSALAKRRLLDAPLILSLLSMTGWFTAIAVFFLGAIINDVSLQLVPVVRFVLDTLLAGSLVFVITYFLLEFISRRYFIPQYFPEGRLSESEGAITLSIRVRFYIYYYAVAIFPIFLFYNIIVVLQDSADTVSVVLPVTVLTGVTVLLGAFVTYLISRAYEVPLVEMTRATEKVRGGDFAIQVRVVSNDEVGQLGEAINEMALGLEEREQLRAEHERVRQELAVAWQIQASFLPDDLPRVPGWQLTATLEPAKQTSGDFYDCIPLSDGRLGLLVADVTDKGMGAALYMALSRTLLRTYAAEYSSRPELAFGAAHRRILADTNTSQFVTVFYGVLDPQTGTLTYSNAGHNPPYLLRPPNGRDAGVEVRELSNTGPPLGLRMFKDMSWEQGTIQLDPGDVLVLYTDGVTEAIDAADEFFDEERMLEVVQANLRSSAQGIQDALIYEVHQFVGQAPQFDDITLMVLVRG